MTNVSSLHEPVKYGARNYQRSGRNTIHAHLDPAHPALTQFLMDHMSHQIANASPGRTIEFKIPIWREALVTAAQEAGFETRVKLLTFGLLL